tara:strand:+ start:225 stop:725 length:501 start_codon:yes stop_codon:yes gene_type:complete
MEYELRLKEIKEKSIDDRNYCTVMASAIAFNTSFEYMQDLYFDLGRRRFRGCYFSEIIEGLSEKFKCNLTIYRKCPKGYFNAKNNADFLNMPRLTPNNANEYLAKGNYILSVRGHVLSLKNGIVEDWTRGKKHQVNTIYKIQDKNFVEPSKLDSFLNDFDDEDFEF